MKLLLLATTFAFPLQANDYDQFPYHDYLAMYQDFYTDELHKYSRHHIQPDELKTDAEKALFFSGCMFSMEHMLILERRH